MLNAGGTVLTLSLTHPVWVRAYVDEKNLGQAQPGTKCCSIPTAGRISPITAKSVFVSPSAEFTPKTVETPDLRTDPGLPSAHCGDPDADGALRQGMPVTISFSHGNGHE